MPLFRNNKASKTHPTPSKVEKTVYPHPVLGDISVSRNPKARRIIVAVKPPGIVRLTLPARASMDEGLRFLESKTQWIIDALEKVERKSPPVIVEPPYSTRFFSLRLIPGDEDRIKARITRDEIIVSYPQSKEYRDEEVQTIIKKGIESGWKIEAKELLPPRINRISRETGLDFNSLTVRNTVSKWGSCSPRNDISLSVHLMRLPDHLIDYIILHELCHTIHKNHGAQFHAMLDKLTGGRHGSLRKELRSYHTRW